MEKEKDFIMEKLSNEIDAVFSALEEVQAGSEEYNAIVKNLKDLYTLRNEETKVIGELELKEAQINTEYELKADEADRSRKWKFVDWAFRILELAVPIGAYTVWQRMGYRYEETGAIRSWTFRDLFKHSPKIGKLK